MLINRIHIFLFSLFFAISYVFGQTHFTVPQNVWRVSIFSSTASGDWIGENGAKEVGQDSILFSDHSDALFGLNSTTFQGTLTELRKENVSTLTSKIEYGFTDKTTVSLEVPYIRNLLVERDWNWKPDFLDEADSSQQTINGLQDYYFSPRRQTSGFGDISLGVKIVLMGTPAWSAKGLVSVYGGVMVQFPSSRPLSRYHSANGSHSSQFEEVLLGSGTTLWKYSFSGEFYKKSWDRLFNISWAAQIVNSSKTTLNTPIFFLGISQTNPDSIAEHIGLTYLYKRGTEFRGMISATLDLWPERISLMGNQIWFLKRQDQFISSNPGWDKRMTSHPGYDTEMIQISQSFVLFLNNLDPLKKIGPIPFIVEIGTNLPILTRNNYSDFRTWIGLTCYFQMW